MISIRTTSGKSFDLPIDLKLSIEETSVFFGKSGSFSLPLELPATANNLAILENPTRIDRRKKFITKMDVIVSAGAWSRHAQLNIEQARSIHCVSCALLFGESPFYEVIKDVSLPHVFKSQIKDPFPDKSGEEKVNSLIRYLNDCACGDQIDDFFVFPVCAQINEMEKTTKSGNVWRWKHMLILNRQETAMKTYHSQQKNRDYYQIRGIRSLYNDDYSTSRTPKGYGITPFLKFKYMLGHLFNHFGYSLDETAFDGTSFQNLCLLNNTADAIVKGYIDYSQLVPDISVSEFLEFAENSFGCEFTINEMFKRVSVVFWTDILNAASEKDITSRCERNFTISYTPSTSLKISALRTNAAAAPMNFKSYSELVAKYGKPQKKKNYKTAVNELIAENDSSGTHFYFMCDTHTYWLFKLGWVGDRLLIEKDTLDYSSDNENDASEERESGFELIPLKRIPVMGYTKERIDVPSETSLKTAENENEFSDTYLPEDGLIQRMPYINSIRNANTVLQKTEVVNGNESKTTEDEDEVSLPIFPCFHVGFATNDPDNPDIAKTFFSTTHRYDNIGNTWGMFDLTPRSLHETFWKKYDSALKTSFHDVVVKPHFDAGEVMQLKFNKLLKLHAQKILPKSIRYEISHDGIEVVEFTLKTIKIYE